MNFLSLLSNREDREQDISKFDFHPNYCQESNLVWNLLLRLTIGSNNNYFFLSLPSDIIIHVSKFSLGITIGEYQYYLNSLHIRINNVLFYAKEGNRRGFNSSHQQIESLLSSLESKIGQDVETSGLKRYIKRELEKINICPLEEKKYIKLKIDYHLKRTRDYAVSGNERMTNFYRKKTEQFMIEFDCSQLSSLNRIQIDKEKIGSFKKKEISSNFEMATKYALLGDRNTFNFYKNKLLVEENESEKDIFERISEIEKMITPFIEIKFLTTKIFKYLKYAEDKAKVKDKARMERYLNQSDRYYQRLLSFPVEDDKNLEINTRIKLINQVFNCPI